MTKPLEQHEEELISFSDFLESHPPNQMIRVDKVWSESGNIRRIIKPEIRLHCSQESCNGVRYFRCITNTPIVEEGQFVDAYIKYKCSNCQITLKTYSVSVKMDESNSEYLETGDCIKYGELPAFGPPTSSKLIKLIGPDRDTFLNGRRCENQGLGIGSFVYYRRVVENQKERILNEIAKVAVKVAAPKTSVELLQNAAKENQFSKAMNMAKPAIPESLLIDGHNPLGLLHSALSEGVHELTDEECLSIAGSIRIVLGELSERLSQALKDEDELKNALSTLLNRSKS